jgi:hypothetical protein
MDITVNHLITSLNLRMAEIDSEIYKAQMDLKAARLAGGDSCSASCYQLGVIETLKKEQESIKHIITGGLWVKKVKE